MAGPNLYELVTALEEHSYSVMCWSLLLTWWWA